MRRLFHYLSLFFLISVFFLGQSLDADSNWPEFRGPTGDGHAGNANLPTSIDPSVVRWKTSIDGKAWSSPVVWENQIWLTNASEDGKHSSVVCVDRNSGRILHNKKFPENESPANCHPTNSYASPTPIVEDGRVYVHFGSDLTACLDSSTAEILWERRDFECDHHRGSGSSPILHNGKLFVAFDGVDVQYVVALDKTTGKTLWKRDREIEYGTDNNDLMKAYCTGSVIHVDGKSLLVYPSAVATIAYSTENGETKWTVYHDGMNASARPISYDGLVFLTNGMGAMVAVRPNGTGNITDTHIEWSSQKIVPRKSSPIIVDGLIFCNSDDGVLSCREAKTGEIRWKKRAGGKFGGLLRSTQGVMCISSVPKGPCSH